MPIELAKIGQPVFSFHTRVGIVKDLPKGTYISYNRSHCLGCDSKIAVLTAGYGDGIPLKLSNSGKVLIHGQNCPILGRVTMDQTIVDITDLNGAARSGDRATLIGRNNQAEITAIEFSQTAETIPWETLCSITKRVERVYLVSGRKYLILLKYNTLRRLLLVECLPILTDKADKHVKK